MQSKFFDLLRSENRKGMTIFFSSHVLSEVQRLCKRVAIIREGKIVQVEDIETLRKKQLKKITLDSPDRMNEESFRIPGIENIVTGPGNRVSLLFSGDISQLIRLLAGRKIDDLMIEEPSLEEIFMHYYK